MEREGGRGREGESENGRRDPRDAAEEDGD